MGLPDAALTALALTSNTAVRTKQAVDPAIRERFVILRLACLRRNFGACPKAQQARRDDRQEAGARAALKKGSTMHLKSLSPLNMP